MSLLKFFSFSYPVMKLFMGYKSNEKPFELAGLSFKNKLGLAAGLDKNAECIPAWYSMGFSHVEVGTITPLPQPGNPKPRLFRLKKDSALINRMGFNNDGADVISERIFKARKRVKGRMIIGVNIGKNKDTPLEKAADDYLKAFKILYEGADYFTINISSPNTKGLRDLQDEDHLENLLSTLQSANKKEKPLMLKIAPDLSAEDISSIFKCAVKHNLAGIIASNTTLSREGITEPLFEEGGLSGKPLLNLSNSVLAELYKLRMLSGDKIALIGVGGVHNVFTYLQKVDAGADLVQIYTGFIYEGPSLIKKILRYADS